MNELVDLEPNEVSLVDEGANRKKFLIWKSQKGNTMQATKEIKDLIGNADPKVMAKVERVVKSLKVKKDDGEESPLSDRAQAALKACARILAPFADEIGDDQMDAMQSEIGMDADDGDDEPVEMKAIPQEVKEEKPVEKKKEKEDDPKEEESVEKVNKSALDLSAFPEGQRGQLEAIFKSNSDLQAQKKELVEKQAKLQEKVERMEAADKERVFVAKAAELKACGIAQEELVDTLRDAAGHSQAAYDRVVKQFETVAKQASQSKLFTEIGSRQSGPVGDAEARLEALVDSTVAKGDIKESRAQIYDRVIQSEQGKKLYAEIKNSRPGGI